MEQSTTSYKIILFDGVCNLCNGAVRFIIEHDTKDRFRFAPLQGETAAHLIQERGIETASVDSIILIDPGTAYYFKSTAALHIAKELSGAWPLLQVFFILPEGFRNIVYDFIARNRYRWFGKKESCMVPTPELKAKFLG